ncbi:hypothetical protein ABIC03_007910 [Bradyrhizobium sp. RT6a]|uniref:hypothetical protein n=1 Tax=Bradyrhizobium sp. RT6a TaxID=3156381 RepID=UPI003398CF8A
MTFIAALISAPCGVDGPINGELFMLYFKKALAPTLAPGEIVILANPSAPEAPTASSAALFSGRGRARSLRWRWSNPPCALTQMITGLLRLRIF